MASETKFLEAVGRLHADLLDLTPEMRFACNSMSDRVVSAERFAGVYPKIALAVADFLDTVVAEADSHVGAMYGSDRQDFLALVLDALTELSPVPAFRDFAEQHEMEAA